MPNCIQFLSKETGEAVVLATLDELICQHFGAEVHPTQWYFGWYNSIAGRLAGHNEASYGQVREELEEYRQEYLSAISRGTPSGGVAKYVEVYARLIEIVNWLEERYTFRTWVWLEERYTFGTWVEIGRK